MTWTAYKIAPIDLGWDLLSTVKEVAGKIAAQDVTHLLSGYPGIQAETSEFLAAFARARDLALALGWQGDYRHGNEPRVFMLPEGDAFAYAFVWKQQENGSTFVVSPRPLPWLQSL
jgi:hypothetical protein